MGFIKARMTGQHYMHSTSQSSQNDVPRLFWARATGVFAALFFVVALALLAELTQRREAPCTE